LLSILLIVQFLCFPEIVATGTIFAVVAFGLAWWIAPQWRRRLQGLILPTFCAYTASALFASPYLYYFFVSGGPTFPDRLSAAGSVRPPNFLIPTTTNLFGTLTLVRKLCRGHLNYEAGAYIALPILLIVLSFARLHWQNWSTRLLLTLLGIVCIASLGPTRHVGGNWSFFMPWSVFSHLPLIAAALPMRFPVYCFLILGIILSLWLSDDLLHKRVRILGACGVVLFTLPNLSASYWATRIDIPAFFAHRLYTHYLSR